MVFDVAEYRHRAAGARLRAGEMPTERAKLTMLEIAEDYERMAQERTAPNDASVGTVSGAAR